MFADCTIDPLIDVNILQNKLSELQTLYKNLEYEFEDSEISSFEMAKDLAYKNYLLAQLFLHQEQVAVKQSPRSQIKATYDIVAST